MRIGPSQIIKTLWNEDYFKERRSLWDVENKIEALGYHFDKLLTQQALKRAKFLFDSGPLSNGVQTFTQKYPPKLQFAKEIDSKNSNFDNFDFHPRIVTVSKSLFETGHYAQCIFEAFKAVEIYVKEKSDASGLIGQNLMFQVFSSQNPKLKINSLSTDSEIDEQEGYKFIFAGAMRGIKDPKSHSTVFQYDVKRTLQLLTFADLLMRTVDKATKS